MSYTSNYDTLKVTTDPVVVEFIDEPYVVHTYRGYTAVADIQLEDGEKRTLFIAPKTLASGLHHQVEKEGQFKGIKVRLKKESSESYSKYIVEEV